MFSDNEVIRVGEESVELVDEIAVELTAKRKKSVSREAATRWAINEIHKKVCPSTIKTQEVTS